MLNPVAVGTLLQKNGLQGSAYYAVASNTLLPTRVAMQQFVTADKQHKCSHGDKLEKIPVPTVTLSLSLSLSVSLFLRFQQGNYNIHISIGYS